MDRYLSGEDVELEVLIDDLEKAVVRGAFYPVIPLSATTGMGVAELLELMTRGFPSPLGTCSTAGHHSKGRSAGTAHRGPGRDRWWLRSSRR